LDFRQTAEGSVVIGFPQPRAQHVVAAKDVERQVAVVVIVAVEEAAFLLAVERQIGGVDIEDDLLGS